jgi:uncharacterized membrane protein YdbT with pleckstrin-like domain
MTDQEILIDETDSEPIVFYRSHLAELPLILLCLALFIAGIYFSFLYPEYIEFIELFTIFGRTAYLPIPLFLLVPIILLAYTLHCLYDAKYILGPDYIRATYGLISFKKKDMRLEFIDIRGIEINRGIYGRLVNVGTLHIGTAMKEEEELFIEKVYNPSQYRDIIIRRRKFLQRKYDRITE